MAIIAIMSVSAMSDNMLTTREAARYLKASEASVRRWADAGLLPAGRVGVRGARRFKEADLDRFMQPRLRPGLRALLGGNGITVQGTAVRIGSHLASFYGRESTRFHVPLPFLRNGLAAGQPGLLFASRPVLDRYLAALAQGAFDVDAAIASGSLTSIPLLPRTPEKFITNLERVLDQILARQPAPVRFVAEAAAGLKGTGSMKALIVQEQLLTSLAARFPVVILCPYDVRAFDGPGVLDALKLHPDNVDYGFGHFLS